MKYNHRWSKAELMEMFQLRIEGCSLQEIGDKFGITRERVRMILNKPVVGGLFRDCIYPAIANYINDNHIVVKDFAERMGCSYATLHSLLSGKRGTIKSVIDKILSETGLTYEEAFRTDADR